MKRPNKIDYLTSEKLDKRFAMFNYYNDLETYADKLEQAINFTGSSLELPNIYEGSLNSERINCINNIKELYNVDGTTISDVFGRGASWYKQTLTK